MRVPDPLQRWSLERGVQAQTRLAERDAAEVLALQTVATVLALRGLLLLGSGLGDPGAILGLLSGDHGERGGGGARDDVGVAVSADVVGGGHAHSGDDGSGLTSGVLSGDDGGGGGEGKGHCVLLSSVGSLLLPLYG